MLVDLPIGLKLFPLNGTGSTFLMGAGRGAGAREASKGIPWNGDRRVWMRV
jgi:hypothetical protein